MTHSLSAGAIALLLLTRYPAAQSPPARAHHVLFYDEARQRVVLTGGATIDSRRHYELLNDIWSFDGAVWTALPPSGERLSGNRVAVDARQRVYSFGGWRDSSLGDLRVLENDSWRRVGAHPSIVSAEGGFVFDVARHRFVAFGGGSATPQPVGEVWEYDGARWTRSSATPPPARSSHAMVYDARRGKTVVFGGMGARVDGQSTRLLGDTWEFDGTAWTQLRVAGPAARLGAGAAYDSKRGLVIVFGGGNDQGVFNDLWAWDGTSWRKLAEGGPEPRVMGLIAYDKRRDRIVLFGGRRATPENTDLGDTWEWDGASWRQVGR